METVDRVVAERGVAGLAATACVRVRDHAGEVVGSGFLVGPDLVATCAHVLADAVGEDPYARTTPEVAVVVDFPVLPSGPVLRDARVHRWVPIGEDGSGDVALLRLHAPAPPSAVMPPVRGVTRLWDHRFRVFGFPEGRSDGVWSTGRIRAAQATGWCQLQGTPGDQPVAGGFSGAPVWDDETGAVVGMTVAADRDPGVTTAYLIPIEQVLGLDPELLPSPYRGMQPFDEEHADYFFGRDADVRRLREAVQRCGLVAVAGPSGAGKSSLVRAGLLPGLRAAGARVGQVRPRGGASVLVDTCAAVLELADPGSAPRRRGRDAERIGTALADPATRDAALAELADSLAAADASRLVLVVDQFEELAEVAPQLARELLGVLASLVAGGAVAAARVVLTVRGLALDEVLTPAIADALGSGTVLVGPMDRANLREAIVRPAERAPGLRFADGLVERILDDAGAEPGQLPLVESLLAQLWARREGGSLTERGYREAGGVAGALATHAERVVAASFESPEALDALRQLLTRLAVPGRDGRFVRRSVPHAQLPERLRELVPPLAAGRLVVVGGGQGAAGTVELAHLSLIEHWPRLRDWLAADRDFLAWRSELDTDRQRWESGGRDAAGLQRGPALHTSLRWAGTRGGELTEAEAEYLRLGGARRHREVRRRRALAAVLAALVLLAGVLTAVAVRSGGRISAQQATADAEALGQAATAHAQTDPLLAAQLALAGWRSDPDSPAARTALGGTYLGLASTEGVVAGAPGGPPLAGVAAGGAGADGVIGYASGSSDAIIVSGLLGAHPTPRRLSDTAGLAGQLSVDGRHYAHVNRANAVQLLEVAAPGDSRQLVAPGPAHLDLIGFSPDSGRFGWLARGADGRTLLTVYDLRSGTARSTALSLPAYPSGLSLTADPDLVVVRQGNGAGASLSVRSLATDTQVRALPSNVITAGSGAYLLGCGPDPARDPEDSAMAVSDAATGALLRRIPLSLTNGCTSRPLLTADGRYLLDTDLAVPRAQQVTWRATELSSGRAFQFVTPPVDLSRWLQQGQRPKIAMLPDGRDGAVALVACGPELLRVRGQPQAPADTTDSAITRMSGDGGRSLVAMSTHDMASYDPVTGHQLASLPGVLSPEARWDVNRDLWVLDRSDGQWVVTGYALPGLGTRVRVPLPRDPAGPTRPSAVTSVVNGPVDGPPSRILVVVDGMLAAWDVPSGRPVGTPTRLATTPEQAGWYRSTSGLWPRVGHPDQAMVLVPGGHLQLWDVVAGRRLLDLPINVTDGSSVLAQGDRLVVRLGGGQGTLDVWNLATGTPEASGLPMAEAESLNGFDAQGRLIASRSMTANDERIVFYDLDGRAEAGTLLPASLGSVSAEEPGRITIRGLIGYLPQALPSGAPDWHDQLCRLSPGELSAAAQDLLPADADHTSPCPTR